MHQFSPTPFTLRDTEMALTAGAPLFLLSSAMAPPPQPRQLASYFTHLETLRFSTSFWPCEFRVFSASRVRKHCGCGLVPVGVAWAEL